MQRVRKQLRIDGKSINFVDKSFFTVVLDTGVELHPDLRDSIILFKDFLHDKRTAYDDNGHGTHICGIIAGTGRMSDGRLRGIAPGAGLIVGKILDGKGNGNSEDMVAALNWVLELCSKVKIRIVNISIGVGSFKNGKELGEIKNIISELGRKGILVICAAGNKGPGPNTISNLCAGTNAVVVGCHDGMFFRNSDKRCEIYSGEGNRINPLTNPDVVAPGTEIVSCCRKWKRDCYDRKLYVAKSGTSMATAIVTGAAILTFSKYSDMDNEQFRRKLHFTAEDLKLPWSKQGFGMVNIAGLLDEKPII